MAAYSASSCASEASASTASRHHLPLMASQTVETISFDSAAIHTHLNLVSLVSEAVLLLFAYVIRGVRREMAKLRKPFTKASHVSAANTYQTSARPKTPTRYRKIMCSHPISRALCREEDIIQLCPPCLMERHIFEIQKIQKILEDRGGIFESRATLDEDGTFTTHKDHITRWRRIKIRYLRDIAVLERMADEPDADKWNVEEALMIWEEEKDALIEVPGYKYIDDKQEPEAHGQGIIGDDNDAEWQTLTHRRPHKHASGSDTPLATPPPQFALKISSSHDVLSPTATPLRSALKRTSQSTSPSPHSRTLTFDDTVTVVLANTKEKPYTSPHNEHTDREEARPRKEYWRPSETYEPKTWASGRGKEKLDTSGVMMSPEDFRRGRSNKLQKPMRQETRRESREGKSER